MFPFEHYSDPAETWPPPGRYTDDVDSYNSWWESVAGGITVRLEGAYRAGRMSTEQERRYARARAFFRQHMPLLERYGLDRPIVALEDETPRDERKLRHELCDA